MTRNIQAICILFLIMACSLFSQGNTIPTITTNSISNITSSTAGCGGNVTNDGNASITARGLCWNTSGTPTITDNFTTENGTTGKFSSSITTLFPGTTYHVRAYATNSIGTAYGSEATFSTKKPIYIKYDASGYNNGTSWNDAFTSFQSGLDAASSGDQIWVAKGTYKPSYAYGEGGTRYNHFQMKIGVAIYGGFTGTEALDFNLNSRNIASNETVLSGDIGTIGDKTDNCYHVFNNPGGMHFLSASAILDGFTISDAYSDGINWPYNQGGGMCNYANSPAIKNCTFKNNFSRNGAAISNELSSNITLINCVFYDNEATNYGGAIYNNGSNTTMTNCSIIQNSSVGSGGGIYNSNGDMSVNNTIIWSNTSGDGNQIYISSASVSINFSCYSNGTNDISGSMSVSNCINTDPKFIGSGSYPFSLLGNSPCINTGNNGYSTLSIDIRGQSRIQNSIIDMGAYEWTSGTDPNGIPAIITNSITDITDAMAKCGGNITTDGGLPVTASGVCWSISHNPTISDSYTNDGNGIGTFLSSLTGLTCGTTYYVRAYATNSLGTAYGSELSFTSSILAVYPTSQAYNLEFSNVTQTSATISWINGNGAKRILLRKTTDFTESDYPADGTLYSTGGTLNSTTVAGIYSGATSSATFTDLTGNSTYYYKMFEFNENSCSNSQAYQTSGFGATNPISLKTSPNQTNNLLVRNYTKTYFDLEWVRGNGTGCIMTCVKGTTSDIINPCYGTTDYNANSNYSSGDRIGTGTPENYVVYKGTGTSCRVAGLTRNTQYSLKVFEYNYFNSHFSYATNNTSGNPRSRITLPKPGYDPEWFDLDNGLTINFKLSPIPANEVLNILLTIDETASINAEIYNMEGIKVMIPVNTTFYQKGSYTIPISIDKLASGSYYLVISGNNELIVQDFVIVH